MRGAALVLTLTALHVQAAVAQQAAPPAPGAAPKGAWQVDWSNERCVLTRNPGADNQVGFAIRLFPGATRPQLLAFVNTETTKLQVSKATKASLELQPAGFKSEIDVAPEPIAGGKVLILAFNGLDARFMRHFSKADQLSFSVRGETMTVPLKNAGKAMEALQQCVDETFVELGLDPKPLANLREPPTGEWQQLATPANYPQAALRARKSGVVIFRAIVDAKGNVTKCSVVESSGTKELDDQTCALVASKARFRPAIAADGSKVTAPLVEAMMWQPTMGRR